MLHLILCVTAWLSSLLSRVQSWTSSSWQWSQKYPEIIKTWSSRRKYKILDFLCTLVSLGEEQAFTEASIAPHECHVLPFQSAPKREFPLIQFSEASMEFPCGLGPLCMSFSLQNSLAESFLLKSIFTYPFSNCLPSSHSAYFPLAKGTKKLHLPTNHIIFAVQLQLWLSAQAWGAQGSGKESWGVHGTAVSSTTGSHTVLESPNEIHWHQYEPLSLWLQNGCVEMTARPC